MLVLENDNSRIDTTNIMHDPLHTSIELFKKAKNKNRMKFSLLIANHLGARIKTEKDWLDAVDFWTKHYFNDPQYLKIDGKPVITVFVSAEINKHIPIIREYVKNILHIRAYSLSQIVMTSLIAILICCRGIIFVKLSQDTRKKEHITDLLAMQKKYGIKQMPVSVLRHV